MLCNDLYFSVPYTSKCISVEKFFIGAAVLGATLLFVIAILSIASQVKKRANKLENASLQKWRRQRESFRALVKFAAMDGAQQIDAYIPAARTIQVNLTSPSAISLSNSEIFSGLLPAPLLPKVLREFDAPFFEFLEIAENNEILVCQRLHRQVRLVVDDLVRLRDGPLEKQSDIQAVVELLDELLSDLTDLSIRLRRLNDSLDHGTSPLK